MADFGIPKIFRPYTRIRFTVQCCVTTQGIFGLYFFKDKRGNEVTVTDAQYYKMLEQFVSPAG